MIQEVLRLGYMILYVDSDVILLKNPFPYLYGISVYDIIAQNDNGDICSGFMFIKPTKQTQYVLERSVALVKETNARDQVAINKVYGYS